MMYELEICEVVLDRSKMGDKESESTFHVELRLLEKKGNSALVLAGPKRKAHADAELDIEMVPFTPTGREINPKTKTECSVAREIPRPTVSK